MVIFFPNNLIITGFIFQNIFFKKAICILGTYKIVSLYIHNILKRLFFFFKVVSWDLLS